MASHNDNPQKYIEQTGTPSSSGDVGRHERRMQEARQYHQIIQARQTWENFNSMVNTDDETSTITNTALKAYNHLKTANMIEPSDETSAAHQLFEKYVGTYGKNFVKEAFDAKNTLDSTEKKRVADQWKNYIAKKDRKDVIGTISRIRNLAGICKTFTSENTRGISEIIQKTIIFITDKQNTQFQDIYGKDNNPTPDYPKALDNLFQLSEMLDNTSNENNLMQEIKNLKTLIN